MKRKVHKTNQVPNVINDCHLHCTLLHMTLNRESTANSHAIKRCRTSDIFCKSHGCDDENCVYRGGKCMELGTQGDCDVRIVIYVD